VVSTLASTFVKPCGMTMQGDSLYVSTFNSHVYKVNPVTGTGVIAPFNAGTCNSYAVNYSESTLYVASWSDVGFLDSANSNTYTSLNLSASPAFSGIYSIAAVGSDLYITEQYNDLIRKISGSTVTIFAGGTTGFADGTGAAAQFNFPGELCTDGTYLYVCDYNNHAVRRITISTQLVETIAGPLPQTTPPLGFIDGKGSAARFNKPSGITMIGNNLYVSDEGNHSIRKIDLSDFMVSTIAGNGTSGFQDGIGSDARFSQPTNMFSDGKVLFVSDQGTNLIKKITFIPKGEIR
jgi:NHL repeat